MSRPRGFLYWRGILTELSTFGKLIIFFTILNLIALVYLAFFVPTERTSLEARIASLSATLSDAAKTVDDAEREIRARQQLVERLRQDQQRYEQLKRLDQAQVDAIAATLQGQLDAAEQRARLAQWLLLPSWGALLGVLFAWVAARAVARRRRTPPQSEGDAGTAPYLEPGP